MTLVYVPTLIESVEQAAALPPGTLACIGEGIGMLTAARLPLLDGRDYGWQDFAGPRANPAMVGWTALVPVEAEEEVQHLWGNGRERGDSGILIPVPPENADRPGVFTERRLVTPWQPALPGTPA